MSMSIELSNTYISANNHEEADLLKFYDSDGKFIDYINLGDFAPLFDEYSDLIRSLFFTYYSFPLMDRDVADMLRSYFSTSVDDVIYNPDFDELDSIYGEDYVNRIGSVALIQKE